jgi:predicted  nucleic acid-binding Zn-ribbon protein
MFAMRTCQQCGKPFESTREHARYCSDLCRVKAFKRNARNPVEPSDKSRTAAMELAFLVGARQAGQITHGQFARASVKLIRDEFATVNEALIALGALAWEGISRDNTPHQAEEHKEPVS